MSDEYIVRDFMTAPVTSVPQDASLLDAALTFRSTGFRYLPVVEGGRIVGVISDRDVQRVSPSLFSKLSQEEYNHVFRTTPIKDVMTRNPITVTPGTPLSEAATILDEHKVGCLPVVQDGQLVGIITVIDMLKVLILYLRGRAGVIT
jgi:acetoin utilization protein AcuB